MSYNKDSMLISDINMAQEDLDFFNRFDEAAYAVGNYLNDEDETSIACSYSQKLKEETNYL